MKTLIVEDDFTSRLLLQKVLEQYGDVHIAVNGREAVDAVRAARNRSEAYDLICLDIMMPEMDGFEALQKIRGDERAHGIESSRGAKIFMTTALDQLKDVSQAYSGLCDAYLVKPIHTGKLQAQLQQFQLT